MVNKKQLFSQLCNISVFIAGVLFLTVSFLPTTIVAENLYISGGIIGEIDKERLLINDSSYRILETVEYLDEKGGPVDNLNLKAGDPIIFQATTDGEIVQITAISSTKAQELFSSKRVKPEAVDSKEPESQQGELKLKNGVWTN